MSDASVIAKTTPARADRPKTQAGLTLALAGSRGITFELFINASSGLREFPLPNWPQLVAKRLEDSCVLHDLPTCSIAVEEKPWPREVLYHLQSLGWIVRYTLVHQLVGTLFRRARE